MDERSGGAQLRPSPPRSFALLIFPSFIYGCGEMREGLGWEEDRTLRVVIDALVSLEEQGTDAAAPCGLEQGAQSACACSPW